MRDWYRLGALLHEQLSKGKLKNKSMEGSSNNAAGCAVPACKPSTRESEQEPVLHSECKATWITHRLFKKLSLLATHSLWASEPETRYLPSGLEISHVPLVAWYCVRGAAGAVDTAPL